MNSEITPKWAKEIIRFLSVKPQFILSGNIYDIYPIEVNKNIGTLKINDYLKNILTENSYTLVLKYEPLEGFELLEGSVEDFKNITDETIKNNKFPATLNKALEVIEKLVNNDIAYTSIILNFSSRLPEITGNDINEFYYRLFRLSHNTTPKIIGKNIFPQFNMIVWLIDKENDIPAWYTVDNSKVKILTLPKADYYLRKTVIENVSKNLNGYNELEEYKKTEIISLFIDQTSGLHASEILSIVSLARRENLPFIEITEAIKRYKLGIIENPWTKLNTEKIKNTEELLSVRVKGQPYAVLKAGDIMKRAVFNLSGAQYSKFSQRPKGVLFFAGPTGVGKTELAKSITELIFGSETNYIRFDMSEFNHEHSDQRLVGSPPGYVGYDVGGELTNSIKQNPFSVVLFDEIEKANPKILDIFLQILDDGRLTSGRGETVYFSESLIIFTSNLGIYELTQTGEKVKRVNQDMSFEEITKKINESIEDFFKYRIGRPEILNRIGQNIVVFDFIREKTAHQIFEKMLSNVLAKLFDTYHITIKITDEVEIKLKELCCLNLEMGGRGVGNLLEEVFINPLSRALFIHGAKDGDNFKVSDVYKDEITWNLAMEKNFS